MPLQDQSRQARKKLIEGEKKDDGVGYPFKMLFKEGLA
jgi:hypothetical protein